jgi:putative heme-binding domain-containing protein
LAFEHKDETRRLRGLWALQVTGGLTEECVEKGLANLGPYVRAWTVQLVLEAKQCSEGLRILLVERALRDPSPVVRLYLASALQRLPLGDRWSLAQALVKHAEDAADPNLSLMVWYGAEPLAEKDPARALSLASQAKLPQILPFMVRRIASTATPEALSLVVKALTRADDPATQKTILRAINEALKGRRQVGLPLEWEVALDKFARSQDEDLRAQVMTLAVTFGDQRAFAVLRNTLASTKADVALRQNALAALLGAQDKDLPPILHQLIAEKALRGAAIRGLASYDDPKTPEVLLGAYATLTAEEKREALNTLAARPAYGKALMEAVAAKKVPANDVPAEVVRQLRNLNDKALDQRIAEAWGIVRTTPADRAKLIADWRKTLTKPYPAPSDLSLGRAIFAKTCQQCHVLYGVGGKVGPEITGSNRSNLDYLLENVLDPSAVIPNDYKATLIELKNGRVVTGIVRGETPAALTVVTANETLTIPRNEIEALKPSDTSMMPDDLLKPLSEGEVRALFAYLRHPNQVPILATPDNAKDLFNGKDLTGWDGDPKLWSVQDGEIVGKSPGIKRNEFLKSQMIADNFRLTLKVKLVPNKENSGVQFRSEALPDGEVKGPQADVGAGWWGKLYEENGRGVLSDNKAGEKVVKVDDWNEYEIVADGSRVRTYLNGKLCVDLDDRAISRRGIFALQIHSGGAMEVRFKDLKLEVLSPRPPEKGK